ncbi:MAG TPA: NUDIX hydrolase [Firmicutes bacterium]|nr:NUDIX hydrolase [Bacillota bacterium]
MVAINDQLHEETLSTSYLYRGRIITVRQDRVRLPGGKTAFREIVEHPGAVAVLAVDSGNRVVFVRQHRQPANTVMLEIPAGKLEPNEEPLVCAKRELLEETGLQAEKWSSLFSFFSSPGFSNELIYLFKAEGLSRAVSHTEDAEENIAVVTGTFQEMGRMIREGKIRDGKTIIAVQYGLLEMEKI